MSRAFVRESDVEAPEELPDRLISPYPNDVTAEGMQHLELMLESAREAHSTALQAQDRSALAVASRDLRYWSARRASARVIQNRVDTPEVQFGSKVTFRRSDGREQTFRIVGEDEANPSEGTVSHASPLARALMGKGVGDVATLGTAEIEILAVR
ncbi:MAG TPA: transcription elongation factor GreA [Candidatus Binatia bacterium]|nr:transcription elongation factor GreA [Candidatus Binatia bacterium]